MKALFSARSQKLLALVLSLVLIVGLTGCSDAEPSDISLVGSISSDNLEVHKTHRDGSRVLSRLPMDLEIEILEQKEIDGQNWGRIDKMTLSDGTKVKAGWIKLEHVSFGEEPTEPVAAPPAETQPEPVRINVNMGTVTAGKLNVRKGPDSGYEVVGSYTKGDRIEILETKTVDDTIWGHTNLGWIGMGYVRRDGTASVSHQQDVASDVRPTSDGSTEVLGYGVVDLGELNVRLGPGTDFGKVRTVTQGVRYAYYQVINDWVRIEDGWVRTDYFYLEGSSADDGITVKVTTDDLNIRTGPNTSFRSCGTYGKDDTIEVLAQVGNWGYTEKGWVFMNYVEPVEPTYTTGTYMVISGLNIRQEPNADSEILGTYSEGDTVTILEVQTNWGRTDKGWINMKYVSLG